jgi:hypothetical protein
MSSAGEGQVCLPRRAQNGRDHGFELIVLPPTATFAASATWRGEKGGVTMLYMVY